ncbi:MAG: hypothetical protein HY763_05095 [Planctomycetes bacterium]|nr:hypothetical protein [Planctomycetota bacterium]
MTPKNNGPARAGGAAPGENLAGRTSADNEHTPRRRLVDILAGQTEAIRKQWERTDAASEFSPLPSGTYIAHLDSAGLHTAKTGTPGVKLAFRVCEGDYAGRFVWIDLWLTPAAMPQTKRDCLKLGITAIDQLDGLEVEPGRIRCKVRVALRRDDDGTERNRVRGFDVLGIDGPPAPDPFAPADDVAKSADGAGAAAEGPVPDEPLDTSFDFGANVASPADGDGRLRPERVRR